MGRILFILLLFSVAFCGEGFAAGEKKIVASTTQIADLARQVVGDRIEVFCVLAPGADPHTYQPTPKDVELVASADLCLDNGMHLEGKNWMAGLAADAGKPLVTTTQGITPLFISEEGGEVADPHAWFSLKNISIYISNILKGASAIEPRYAKEFEARARLYMRQIRTLDIWIREQVRALPEEQRILVTTHDAFNYFCREYGFNKANNYLSIAPVGWSTGAEIGAGMTPARRAMVVQSIRESGAPAIFVETTINPKQLREIAKETGVAIGGELYSDSMGVEGSAGESYLGMMRENVLLITQALKGNF